MKRLPLSISIGVIALLMIISSCTKLSDLCNKPGSLSASSSSTTTANISWSASTSLYPAGYNWEIRSSGSGGSGSAGLVASGSTTSHTSATATGLSLGTAYNLYVQTNCNTYSKSDWAGPKSFTTSTTNTDNTLDWVGTYNGTVGGTNYVNRVIVSRVDNSTVKMQLQLQYAGFYTTYATIQSAAITGNNASINEDGLIASYTAIHHFTGSAVRNGNNLTISGTATNTTNSSDVKYYYFTGSK